jgi:hypothetical protein
MRIKRFNESVDWSDDDEIPEGYVYSWADIFDMVIDLIDIDFEVIKNDRYFIDKDDKEISLNKGDYYSSWRYNSRKTREDFYRDTKGTCYILKMSKSINLTKFNEPHSGYLVSKYNFHNSTSEMLKILEIINYLEKRAKVYHAYEFDDGKISLILMIQSKIPEGYVEKQIEEHKNYKVQKYISEYIFEPIYNSFSDENKNYTKKFRENAFDILKFDIDQDFYEKSKMAIFPINLNFTKGVLNSNMVELEKSINYLKKSNKERGIEVDWRKITKEEANKVGDSKIEGMMGIILNYDIKKVIKYVNDKIEKGETWSI